MSWAEIQRHGEGPAIDDGPLQAYLNAFPDRYVLWNVQRGLWEIRQGNPEAYNIRIELVFEWALTDEAQSRLEMIAADQHEIALQRMIENKMPGMTKKYRPFDWEFVELRLKNRAEFYRKGTREYNKAINAHNDRIATNRLRSAMSELNYFFEHDKRWLDAIAAKQAGESIWGRSPQVQGGLTLKEEAEEPCPS